MTTMRGKGRSVFNETRYYMILAKITEAAQAFAAENDLEINHDLLDTILDCCNDIIERRVVRSEDFIGVHVGIDVGLTLSLLSEHYIFRSDFKGVHKLMNIASMCDIATDDGLVVLSASFFDLFSEGE